MIKRLIATIFLLALMAGSVSAATYTCDFSVAKGYKSAGLLPFGTDFTSKTNIPTSQIGTYQWYFLPFNGGNSYDDWMSLHPVTAAHTFKDAGFYTVALYIYDKKGHMLASQVKNGFVEAVNCDFGPIGVIEFKHPANVGFYAFYTAHGTASYKWVFGDGTSATTTKNDMGHKYVKAGRYTVSITVTDSLLGTKTITHKDAVIVK